MADIDEENDEENVNVDFSLCQRNKLCDGRYHIVFAHPETLISSKCGRELLLSETYQANVLAIVVDEAYIELVSINYFHDLNYKLQKKQHYVLELEDSLNKK